MSFALLPASRREEYTTAFNLLAIPAQPPAGSTQDVPLGAPKLVVRLESLVNLLRIMNISIPDENLVAALQKLDGGADINLNDRGFTFQEVREMYDVLAPMQGSNITPYLQFFNLLDVHEVGSIPVADLKHALCTVGDKLAQDEFHHLLYKNDLLQKERLTVFEFLRVLLKVQGDGQPL